MDQILLIGNTDQHVGTVKRLCRACNVAVYVQIENVPHVENSQGHYLCAHCAIALGIRIDRFLHHGKRYDQPTGEQLTDIIRDVIKRSRGL